MSDDVIRSAGGWCAPADLVYPIETPPKIDWSKMPMPQGVRGGPIFTPNTVGPDGRVTWNTEKENDMTPNCEQCNKNNHSQCYQRGSNSAVCECDCETATQARKMIRAGEAQWGLSARLRLVKEAMEASHVEYDTTGGTACSIPAEVLAALLSRAKKWDEREQYHAERTEFLPTVVVNVPAEAPEITAEKMRKALGIRGETEDIKEGVAENGDPMYQRAKEALESVETFRAVEVDHETDIITTSADGGRDVARYRSGVTEVTITIRGYTR
jgi:hypothetical protein